MRSQSTASGFTLVEINLAIMLLAIGLLVVFSLFPAGLSQGDLAYRDTQAGLFADYVMNGLHGNVSQINRWQNWESQFQALALSGIGVSVSGSPQTMQFPAGSGHYVRYMLTLGGSGSRRTATLWVWGRRYGTTNVTEFKSRARRFHTGFYFSGGQP